MLADNTLKTKPLDEHLIKDNIVKVEYIKSNNWNLSKILKNWSKYQDDEIESLENEKIIQSID